MKKFGLYLICSVLCAFVGCSDDDTTDVAVPTLAKPAIAVNENTPTSFGVEWEAVENAFGYQYEVTKCDDQGNVTSYCPETQTGATSLRFADAEAGIRYTVRVKSLAQPDSKWSNSDYAEIYVEVLSEGLSAQTFSFEVQATSYDSATVKVKPSINNEKYYFAILKSSSLINKNSNAIIKLLKDKIESSSLVEGEQTLTEQWLDPETAYTAVAFGYDTTTGTSTSLLSRSDSFNTAVDTRMSIEVLTQEVGDYSISTQCIPSVSRATYFASVVPASKFTSSSDHEVQEALLDEVNQLVTKNGWSSVAGQLFRTGTTNYTAESLSIGTEYYIVAFGVQQAASGVAEATTRLFKTKAKTSSPVALVDFSLRIVDGEQLVTPQVGKAAVGIQFKPNDATVHYGFGVFNASILDLDADDVAAYLTGDPAEMDPEDNFIGYYVMDWGRTVYIATVGVNAIGELGPLQIKEVTITDDNLWDGSTDWDRSDVSVSMAVTMLDAGNLSSQYSGYPALILQFTPGAGCEDYRWMDFLKVGVVEQYGENTMLDILMDSSYHYDGTDSDDIAWYDRSDTDDDVWGSIYNTGILGYSYDIVLVALNAAGVPGKMVSQTINWPSSISALSSSSVHSIPSSTMLSRRPLTVHKGIDICRAIRPQQQTFELK
jgi:hypothetical protein